VGVWTGRGIPVCSESFLQRFRAQAFDLPDTKAGVCTILIHSLVAKGHALPCPRPPISILFRLFLRWKHDKTGFVSEEKLYRRPSVGRFYFVLRSPTSLARHLTPKQAKQRCEMSHMAHKNEPCGAKNAPSGIKNRAIWHLPFLNKH